MELILNKSVYTPGETVLLKLQGTKKEDISLSVFSLDEEVEQLRLSCEEGENEFSLKGNFLPGKGYGIVCISESGENCRTAFDVQEKTTVFRYGFLSDFSTEESDADIQSLVKHHINAVQFYDWVYRHDSFLPPEDEYSDLMGKHNSLPVIRKKISQCHEHGLKAIGYGAVYAAGSAFAEKHPEWRLYAEKNRPLKFIDVFSIMNLRSGWKEHIISEYGKAMDDVGFDGIHMDTYGFPKTALDADGKVVHLEDDFVSLISEVREQHRDSTLLFNNVGAWPAEKTVRTETDAFYIEVWPPFEKYCHIKELIGMAKTSGKPVILAAYPAAFRTNTPERGLNAQLVLMCAIAAHGATQLWFGEDNAAITQGYYADYYPLPAAHEIALRRYDDFFVRYEELFFDDALKDVSMTHCGWDNVEYQCSHRCSVDGRGDTIWLIIREKPGRKLISLLNLCGDESENWADGRNDVTDQTEVMLRVQCFGNIKRVLAASPDFEQGNCKKCRYMLKQDKQGPQLELRLERIHRFSFVLIDTEE